MGAGHARRNRRYRDERRHVASAPHLSTPARGEGPTQRLVFAVTGWGFSMIVNTYPMGPLVLPRCLSALAVRAGPLQT